MRESEYPSSVISGGGDGGASRAARLLVEDRTRSSQTNGLFRHPLSARRPVQRCDGLSRSVDSTPIPSATKKPEDDPPRGRRSLSLSRADANN